MSEGAVPGSAPNTSNKVMVRNIITGVITTVVGASVIYFLGFHNSGPSEGDLLVTKEATINTWKSYVSAENVFYQNYNTFAFESTADGIDRYKKSITEELDRFNKKVENILKTKSIDVSLSSLLERRVITNRDWVDKYKKYLDNYKEIIRSGADQEEIKRRGNEALQTFQNDVKDINQRFINEITDVCKTLTAKYNSTFAMTDLIMYQQQPNQNNTNSITNTNNNNNTDNNNTSGTDAGGTVVAGKALVGKWLSGANTLYQYEDGKMYYYYSNGDSTYGSWQIYNNLFYHYYNQYYGAGYKYVYNLSNITPNAFSITMVDSPYTRFDFIRAAQ